MFILVYVYFPLKDKRNLAYLTTCHPKVNYGAGLMKMASYLLLYLIKESYYSYLKQNNITKFNDSKCWKGRLMSF